MIASVTVLLFPCVSTGTAQNAGSESRTAVAGSQASETYQFILLRRNPNRTKLSEEEGNRIQAAHMANIQHMADSGKLVAAGPLEDEPSIVAGFFIVRMPRLSDALTLAANDPTVLEHRNTVEGFTWLAPPGLGEEYRRIHTADPKAPVNMKMHPVCFLRSPSEPARSRDLPKDASRIVQRMHRDGLLASGGAVTQKGPADPLAVLIFRAVELTEAQKQMSSKNGEGQCRLICEWHQWYSADHVLPW